MMSSSSAIVVSSCGKPNNSSSLITGANHMPATVTQAPEPQILYEHCVRPSGVKNFRSPCCPKADACLGRHATEDKSVQTVAIFEPAANSQGEVGGQSNEEVHTTELSELSQQPQLNSKPPAACEVVTTTRSQSRDSLSTWPPATAEASELEQQQKQQPTRLMVLKRRKRLTHKKRSESAAISCRTISTNTPHQMPMVDWSIPSGARADRPLRKALRKLSRFIFYGTLVLALSTMMQWSFLMQHCQTGREDVKGTYATVPHNLY